MPDRKDISWSETLIGISAMLQLKRRNMIVDKFFSHCLICLDNVIQITTDYMCRSWLSRGTSHKPLRVERVVPK